MSWASNIHKRRADLLQRAQTSIENVSDAQLASMLAFGGYHLVTDAAALAGSDVSVVPIRRRCTTARPT